MRRVGALPLVLREAAFGYADLRVVSGVTLTVAPGDVVAVLGPNGSGKSTIVRGVLGLADHLGGSVEVLGQDPAAHEAIARAIECPCGPE